MSECRYEIMSALAGNNASDPLVVQVDERVSALTASLVRRTRKEKRIPKRVLIMRPRSVLCEVALEIFITSLERVSNAPAVEIIDSVVGPARELKSATARSGP